MKKINLYNKKTLIVGCLCVVGAFTSCDDFLTLYPTSQITEEEFWQDKNDLNSGVGACYEQYTNSSLLTKIIEWGEYRSDNLTVKDVSSTSLVNLQDGILQSTQSMFKWDELYKDIAYCNTVLAHGEEVVANDPSFSESDWVPIRAEMIGLRSLSYFYLVRSFRDVPVTFEPITTDEEAKAHIDSVTPALEILDHLISDLDSVKDEGMTNYGNDIDNKGRITKRSLYALLADVYLWKASMLKEGASGVTKDTVNADVSKECFKQCIACCDFVINDMQAEQDKELIESRREKTKAKGSYGWLLDKYPLIYNNISTLSQMDKVHEDIFIQGTSSESIFEILFDGNNNNNSMVNSVFGNTSTGSFIAGAMVGSQSIFAVPTTMDPSTGYSKTDYRYLTTIKYDVTASKKEYPITKFVARNVYIEEPTDMAEGYASTSSYKSSSSNDADFIVYRLSDVMLMKAEAISRIYSKNTAEMYEGFALVNAIYARSNPAADSTGVDDSEVTTSRFTTGYAKDKDGSTLYDLVLNERQLEFIGEGKRWFDLVRMAEADGSTTNALKKMGAVKSVSTRLKLLLSFYNPISIDELKLNENLQQNPVWYSSAEENLDL